MGGGRPSYETRPQLAGPVHPRWCAHYNCLAAPGKATVICCKRRKEKEGRKSWRTQFCLTSLSPPPPPPTSSSSTPSPSLEFLASQNFYINEDFAALLNVMNRTMCQSNTSLSLSQINRTIPYFFTVYLSSKILREGRCELQVHEEKKEDPSKYLKKHYPDPKAAKTHP